MDADNHNAQNSNARAILRSWSAKNSCVRTLTYGAPDIEVANNPLIEITRLWRRRAWLAHLFCCYLRPCDAIFYPGVHTADFAGLRWRRRLGLDAPVIATLEGLIGDDSREAEYSRVAGHPVHCQHAPTAVIEHLDALYRRASHVIAISPFLARMGAARYGEKFSVIPLGIDTELFRPSSNRENGREPLIVCAGRVASHKRPQVFIDLAMRFRDARFRWYGEGSDRVGLIAEASRRGLTNLEFPGEKGPADIAEAFRQADILVLPSLSEGVPKVTQEAAACGLPVIAFGCYEPPSVIDNETGFLVWNDHELVERLERLLGDATLRQAFGAKARDLALGWSWDRAAPLWESQVMRCVRRG